MNIQYSPEAIGDLVRLREFIKVNNPYAAKRVADRLIAGIENLKALPKIGLLVQRSPDPEKVRDLFITNYTVRYLLGEDTIFILRVWHGKEIEKDL
ncbi:type II toxin-antitoxin system RelE/ParE family toxin [Shewanella inventionis]|uniref:Plasmid stabilization protein n=1 Tax=Shewanella inventionis TaxID=1738770 RepID=A0ABQ1JU70_9GAMM|nr:type II toxin-antitoxin system RelE/ParE family toxin [Shewanella inventionis]MCL1159990.1 type II toxin-antitoxin system RelE/ParE family toxin [Shewanella inventionis]UAL44593.1 type II toxin-antitoxin system RelE/ParE family toxin [Shewanella inventionis]GGB74670.1 plasmid stabilization protein [Shewanella inventionis]